MEKISISVSVIALFLSGYTYYTSSKYQRQSDVAKLEMQYLGMANDIHTEFRKFHTCTNKLGCVVTHPDFEFPIIQMRAIRHRLKSLGGDGDNIQEKNLEDVAVRVNNYQRIFHPGWE